MHGLYYLSLFIAGSLIAPAFGAQEHVIEIDFRKTNGVFRPLHSINKGGFAAGGTISLAEQLRPLNIPFARLHDCQWPTPDVVDIHAIFRDPKADPDNPQSYDFALTDEYLRSVFAAGMQVVYRLGESIEHTEVKRFVHPPVDPDRWADVCLGIIRHQNEGWAGGFRHGIRYWEIWNEPENRPAMWSGTDEDYFRLYSTAAARIKRQFPNLKVGGPSVGYSGSLQDAVFRPSAFVTNFLTRCRRDSIPLDFFSWHCYTDNPSELCSRANAIRKLLDQHEFTKTESHLNEWNYLPGNSWAGASRKASPQAREKYYRDMSGDAGAAFIVAALIELQDAPVDMANLFHGEIGAFGLFNEFGVPQPNYHALKTFARIAGRPRTIMSGSIRGELAVAVTDDLIVISNLKDSRQVRLRMLGFDGAASDIQVNGARLVRQSFRDGELPMELRGPSITVVQLRRRPE